MNVGVSSIFKSLRPGLSWTRRVSQFKSSICLQNLYPKSSLSIDAPVKIPEIIGSTFNGVIPVDKLDITYSRSSGPGGQHINKVNTKVDIRFHVESADWLDKDLKSVILEKYKSKINKDGYLVVRSDLTRSQLYNQANAMKILREMLWTAAAPPQNTEPSELTLHLMRIRKEKMNRERLAAKRMRSQTKESRRGSGDGF